MWRPRFSHVRNRLLFFSADARIAANIARLKAGGAPKGGKKKGGAKKVEETEEEGETVMSYFPPP